MATEPNAPGTSSAKPSATSLHDAVDDLKASAGDVLDDAKNTARSRLNEQKDVAADGIDRIADSLRHNTSGESKAGQRDPLGGVTDSAAQGLERLSHTLRTKDVGDIVRDVESFARRQPVAFFGLAVATGFLAVRFLKASGHADSTEGTSDSKPRALTAHGTQGDVWKTR